MAGKRSRLNDLPRVIGGECAAREDASGWPARDLRVKTRTAEARKALSCWWLELPQKHFLSSFKSLPSLESRLAKGRRCLPGIRSDANPAIDAGHCSSPERTPQRSRKVSEMKAISGFFDVTKCVEDHWSVRQRYYENRKNSTVKKFVEKRDRKSTKGPPKRVKEVACEEPKPLQAKSLVKEAGEKIRSFHTDRLPVASGDRLVGAVEGKYPERKAAGFGHDPETTLVREIMVRRKCIIASKISRWMRHGKSCASITSNICPLWTKIYASLVPWG